jgi:hypothetical protein
MAAKSHKEKDAQTQAAVNKKACHNFGLVGINE